MWHLGWSDGPRPGRFASTAWTVRDQINSGESPNPTCAYLTNHTRICWEVPRNWSIPPPLYTWGDTVDWGRPNQSNQSIYLFFFILALGVAVISPLHPQSSHLFGSMSSRGVIGGLMTPKTTLKSLLHNGVPLVGSRSRFCRRSSQPSKYGGHSDASGRQSAALHRGVTPYTQVAESGDLPPTVRAHTESTPGPRSSRARSGCARWLVQKNTNSSFWQIL